MTSTARLSEIAKSQPHAAYAAFIHGEQHRYTYFLRTITNISSCLQPLDDIITTKFIPSIFGSEPTEAEREVFSLPIKDGGLGMRFVSKNADVSYNASRDITKPLVEKITCQSNKLPGHAEELNVKSTAISKLKSQEKACILDIKSK